MFSQAIFQDTEHYFLRILHAFSLPEKEADMNKQLNSSVEWFLKKRQASFLKVSLVVQNDENEMICVQMEKIRLFVL